MTNEQQRRGADEGTAARIPEGELVNRIAALARLDVRSDEAQALGRQFANTLKQFEGLARLDVGGVEPLVSLSGADNVLRADEPVPSLSADQILANAPERVDDFYRVPKTVGGDE